jgi:hypothetical protein
MRTSIIETHFALTAFGEAKSPAPAKQLADAPPPLEKGRTTGQPRSLCGLRQRVKLENSSRCVAGNRSAVETVHSEMPVPEARLIDRSGLRGPVDVTDARKHAVNFAWFPKKAVHFWLSPANVRVSG